MHLLSCAQIIIDMRTRQILFWVATVIMCAIFLFSAFMYFTQYDMVKGFFEALGYPIYIIYPLAIAKVLGVIAILSNQSRVLTEWAYAGFFFDAVLATAAHHYNGDGLGLSLLAIIVVVLSRNLNYRM